MGHPRNQFHPSVYESLLKSLRGKPLNDYIEAHLDALSERILNVRRSPLVERFPCRLCLGAGFLVQRGEVCAVDYFSGDDPQIQPIKTPRGTITISTAHECPRCLGQQYDLLSWVDACEAEARERAA